MPRSRNSSKSKDRILKAKSALMITSTLDIMTTLLFFLLQNFSHVMTNFRVANDLKLPASASQANPPDSTLNLTVTQTAIILDDVQLVPIVNGQIPKEELFKDGVTITKLAQALNEHKKRSKGMEIKTDNQHQFNGDVFLQADKDLKYDTIKRVIYTAGVTDFINLKLAAIRKEK